jgi:tetratricopeptide (TPR) repeat protein
MATKKVTTKKQKAPLGKKKTRPEPKADASSPPRTVPLEVDPAKIDETLARLKEQVVVWAKKGRYTRVRFKFRGKQILPDLPLAAVAAVEGVTFYWAGLLRVLVMNLAGRALLEVELVNDAERKIAEGREKLLAGDLAAAAQMFRAAVDMDEKSAAARLNLGIALKLEGDVAGARAALTKAIALDAEGIIRAEAEKVLASIRPG